MQSSTIKFIDIAPSAEAFKALYDTTGWGPPERQTSLYARALEGSWLTCAAYHGDELVGFGRVISDGELHAFITEMIVAPSFQLQGVGKEIVQRLIGGCLERGVTDIQLFCAQGKRPFYEKAGFMAREESRPGMQFVGHPAPKK
jgi:GNAT superfamily N-acetyltransferase